MVMSVSQTESRKIGETKIENKGGFSQWAIVEFQWGPTMEGIQKNRETFSLNSELQ